MDTAFLPSWPPPFAILLWMCPRKRVNSKADQGDPLGLWPAPAAALQLQLAVAKVGDHRGVVSLLERSRRRQWGPPHGSSRSPGGDDPGVFGERRAAVVLSERINAPCCGEGPAGEGQAYGLSGAGLAIAGLRIRWRPDGDPDDTWPRIATDKPGTVQELPQKSRRQLRKRLITGE